jgi:HlyD family secretion protein
MTSRKSFVNGQEMSALKRQGVIKVLALLAILLTVGGVAGLWLWTSKGPGMYSPSDEAPILREVTSGPFDHIVLEKGEVESSSNNEVKCEVKGRGGSGTPILNVIAEGTFVKKGDKLCQLDSSALDQEAKNQRIVVSSAESTVISSEALVSKAAIAKQEYLEGTYLTERKAILSEIALAQQGLRKSELSLQSAERLAAKGTLKALQIESEQFAVQNSQSTLESAEARLKVLDNLTKEKMLVQLNSDIETAAAKLASDKNTLSEEKEKLEEIRNQIKACTVLAPADGQVVFANKFGGRGGGDFIVEAGALVREQQTIFLLPDPSRMQVKAKVNESRITLIREGMPVKIAVGAVNNELLGRVIKVNKYAEPGNFWGSSVKEYAVIVQILEPPPEIRTGMTAEVRVFVDQIADAIQLPVRAVYETKRHHFVLTKKGDGWETREIKIGATNDKFVTISSGLTQGETVVLDPRSHLDKMKIPEIAEVDDRDKLAKIAAESPKPVADSGPPRTPGGRGPGGGGGGAMNPDAIATMILGRLDTNTDGKLSKDEVASDERMKSAFGEYDSNSDGSIDQAEIVAGLRKRMAAGGGGGGGGGPARGAPAN